MSLPLADLMACFHGAIPSSIATVGKDGMPNLAFLSQVHYVDPRHVAISCQFFNQTRRNLSENPSACAHVTDPGTLMVYRLKLRFERSETSGPLFETMSARLEAIAAQTGLAETFKLRSADLFECLAVESLDGAISTALPVEEEPPDSRDMTTDQLRGLQAVAASINRAKELPDLLRDLLPGLDRLLGLRQTLLLLQLPGGQRLRAAAAHGFPEEVRGFEVGVGEGLLGAVASSRQSLRISRLDREMRYARSAARTAGVAEAAPVPGLPGAQSLLAAPLVAHGELLGVLAAASERSDAFGEREETVFSIAVSQAAAGIHGLSRATGLADASRPLRRFQLHREDEAIFVDREYLTRGVAALIAWKLLKAHQAEGRTSFTNRELRMDPELKLPDLKDNLESRLSLLRKRLEQKCPDLRIVPTGRGRFELEVDCEIEVSET